MSKSILNRDFKYTCAANTNISRTFARIRKQIAEEKAARERDAQEVQVKVSTLRTRSK